MEHLGHKKSGKTIIAGWKFLTLYPRKFHRSMVDFGASYVCGYWSGIGKNKWFQTGIFVGFGC